MRHFWQWFCGYICICVIGRQANRFLNLCSRNGIQLWRIKHELDQRLYVSVKLRDFYSLKPYLKKTKTKLRILEKKGFPFWCYRHPRMKWFLCISMLVFLLGIFSLNYIWTIKIFGNSKVLTEEIMSCLHENNITIGQNKNKIDCTGIELLLRETFHDLGWVSVYIDDTQLCIQVKESLYDISEHQSIEYGKQYNLIANKDARIYSVVTRAGMSCINEGQVVKKGEVLILGQNNIYDDSGMVKDILYLKASAEVYGDVMYDILIPLSEIELISMKIANKFDDRILYLIGNHKLQLYLEQLELQGKTILDSEIRLEKNEKNICFLARIYVREQIGINIPVEEIFENEFE